MIEARALRLSVLQHACGNKCMGHSNNSGGCCKLGQRDWIIGPVDDVDAFLARLSQRLGRPVERREAIIDFDEGTQLFPGRSTWQNPAHYPAMRIRSEDPHACQFHTDTQGCTIHEVRPRLCQGYECSWLEGVLSPLF